jgi:hypothetical protein
VQEEHDLARRLWIRRFERSRVDGDVTGADAQGHPDATGISGFCQLRPDQGVDGRQELPAGHRCLQRCTDTAPSQRPQPSGRPSDGG